MQDKKYGFQLDMVEKLGNWERVCFGFIVWYLS